MIGLLMLAALQASAVDAERDFARMAQTQGQWTAFRAFAAPEGIFFTPQPANVHEALKDAPDPPQSVMWWPARSWVSCDGAVAVNTGPWLRAGGTRQGSFTTVWKKRPDGSWKWLLDQGRQTPRAEAAAEQPQVQRASCLGRGRNPAAIVRPTVITDGEDAIRHGLKRRARDLVIQEDGLVPAPALSEEFTADWADPLASGQSDDGTLVWVVRRLDHVENGRVLLLHLWNGKDYELKFLELSDHRPAKA